MRYQVLVRTHKSIFALVRRLSRSFLLLILYEGTAITVELDGKIDHQTLDLLRDPIIAAEHRKL